MIDWTTATCEEVLTMVGSIYLRCGEPAVMQVKHRGRDEGPYVMCRECGEHNARNRNAVVLARKALPKVNVISYEIAEHLMPEVYALLSRLEKQS